MSDKCNKIERYFGDETIEGDHVKIKFSIPPNTEKKDIKLKIGKNSYIIEFDREEGKKEDGWIYHSSSTGHYMKSFAFEIKEPVAKVEDGILVLSFEKGESVKDSHEILEIED